MLTATPRGRNQYSHFYKKEKLRCNKRWYGDLNMQPSGVPILTAEEWALNEHGGSFWALGLDRNAQTSDGGHVQIHKQRWCWSPRFHKDYKLSILSVNDKIIPSHFYIACFLLRIRDKIFLVPSAKKKTGKGQVFPSSGIKTHILFVQSTWTITEEIPPQQVTFVSWLDHPTGKNTNEKQYQITQHLLCPWSSVGRPPVLFAPCWTRR